MGSNYDFFDHASYHNSNLVPKECIEKRNYLKTIMNLYGFQEYPKEWWHYTLVDEPFPNKFFDFDIEPFSNKK